MAKNPCHTDWCLGMQKIKTSLLKVRLTLHTTLLSDANVPVQFPAQQRAKYSSQQLTANCIAAKRCLRHYFKLIWESPTTEDTNFHRHQRSFPFSQNSNRMATRLTTIASFPSAFFNSCNIQGNIQAYRLTGLIWWQKLTRLFQHFLSEL